MIKIEYITAELKKKEKVVTSSALMTANMCKTRKSQAK